MLYEHNIKLVISADAEPTELYRASEGREAFEFDARASRLIEMRSEEYLARSRGRVGETPVCRLGGLVET